jgi:hypothetical protein
VQFIAPRTRFVSRRSRAPRRLPRVHPIDNDAEPQESLMTTRFTPRALSFAMAASLTWSMLFGIDSLATTRHAAHDLMAQVRAVLTA